MGSTGHSILHKSSGNIHDKTFGIVGAVNYTGDIPMGKGLEPKGSNKITLKVDSTDKLDIIFQFKLTKNNKMSIMGYDPNHPESKAHVHVDAKNPSLDKVAIDGSVRDKRDVIKLKQMMNKSTDIKESNLQGIANELLSRKKER